MRVCPACKKTYQDNTRFCGRDGMPLVDQADAEEPTPPPLQAQVPATSPPPKGLTVPVSPKLALAIAAARLAEQEAAARDVAPAMPVDPAFIPTEISRSPFAAEQTTPVNGVPAAPPPPVPGRPLSFATVEADAILERDEDTPPPMPDGPEGATDADATPDASLSTARGAGLHAAQTVHAATEGPSFHEQRTLPSFSDPPNLPPRQKDDSGAVGVDEATASAYIGKVIDDRYHILELLGRGGMGSVYKVEQIHLRKILAMKLLHENLVARKQLVSRFTREARAISKLSSQHTVQVYDFGRFEEVFYLVMEHLEGVELDKILNEQGAMPPERAVRIVIQMCESLGEAHAHGIVHRDLKPENVMILKQGPKPDFVKIMDFGLAKVRGLDDPYTVQSQKDIFGTPYYMSPEQIRAKGVDTRADVYALGALLFKMLTGHFLFEKGSTFDILKAHLSERPPHLKEVAPERSLPEVLDVIVQKLLRKSPDLRFQTVDELRVSLESCLAARFKDVPASLHAAQVDATKDLEALDSEPTPPPGPAAATSATLERTVETAPDDTDAVLLEKTGKRKRMAAVIGVGVAALCALALFWGQGSRRAGPAGEREDEPNNSPQQAVKLGPSAHVLGKLWERRSQTESDRDCYRVGNESGQPALMDVQVSGLPTMDLAIELYSAEGEPYGVLDARVKGEGERADNVRMGASGAVICVREQVPKGAAPQENATDAYDLSVRVGPLRAGWEIEPNGNGAADKLDYDAWRNAKLDGSRDIDVFALPGGQKGGHVYTLMIAAPEAGSVPAMRVVVRNSADELLLAHTTTGQEHEVRLPFAGATEFDEPARIEASVAAGSQGGGYRVRLEVGPLAEALEKEPNDRADDAELAVPGRTIRGTVSAKPNDVDFFRVPVADAEMKQLRVGLRGELRQPYMLTVVDLGTLADLATALYDGDREADKRELRAQGSGHGFLVRIEAHKGGRARGGLSNYRVDLDMVRPQADKARAGATPR